MPDQSPTHAERLAQTSEIYRRLRSTEPLLRSEPSLDLPGGGQLTDSTRALPPAPKPETAPPAGPTFLRRMLTRRIDAREVLLLLVTLAVVITAYR